MIFKKYHKIRQFSDVVREIIHAANFKGMDGDTPIYEETIKPVLEFDITTKLHGCLPAKQKIRMWDNSLKKISNVKEGDYVVGYDEKNERIVKSKVLNKFTTGYTEKWLNISRKLDRYKLGQSNSLLKVTEGHKIFIEGKGYTEAKFLRSGDKIISYYKDFKISKDIKDVLTGILLSDGYIDKSTKNHSLIWGHKEDHEEYIDYIYTLLGDLGKGSKRQRVSGYGTNMIDAGTKYSYSINDEFNIFYKDKERFFPRIKLSPLILAFWYMGDGSLAHHRSQKDRANIAICAYKDSESIINIKKSLEDFGFSNFTIYNADGYNRLRFNNSDIDLLFESIKSLVPSCMQYKLSKQYRGFFKSPNIEQSKLIYYKTFGEVLSIESIDKTSSKFKPLGSLKHDITTETSNFFSGDILVHNSNAGICYDGEKMLAQKRSSLLDKEALSAHMGFNQWVQVTENDKLLPIMENLYKLHCKEGEQITLFGEWAGNKIQKGVSISELPKAFYTFDCKVYNADTDTEVWVDIRELRYEIENMYNIHEFFTDTISIDFNNPKLSQQTIVDLTNKVEECCPVAKDLGKKGIGEGIVLTTYWKGNKYIFKSKGLKHSTSKVKTLANVDPEEVKNISEFVSYAVTPNRIEQGIKEVEAREKKDIPNLLRWICNDIIEEEKEVLKANGLEWKKVAREVANQTRIYYFKKLTEV